MGKFLKVVGVIVKTCVAPRPPPLQGAHWSGSGWTPRPPGPAPTLPGARNPGRAQATLTESEAGSPPSLWNARSTAGFPCLIATACARRGPYGPSLLRQRQGCTEAPRDGTETSARSRLRPPAPAPRPPLRGPLPPRPFPVPAHRNLGALSRRGPSRWSTGGDRGGRRDVTGSRAASGGAPGAQRGMRPRRRCRRRPTLASKLRPGLPAETQPEPGTELPGRLPRPAQLPGEPRMRSRSLSCASWVPGLRPQPATRDGGWDGRQAGPGSDLTAGLLSSWGSSVPLVLKAFLGVE